ncbi:hypothetical protein BHE74_00045983 [Ensete ventricosum]|uniref:Neprosin PEP catalytic domain-containing protein n=1 Tax=Ensete ventricosum TaxID=4639 RepID=A0A445MCA2_ENSVE|nr:hypothetical protein BHE74_00045983 [Ensete ventricosum]RZR71887.1 hypothetical protein BHM03_00008322 [Ensete ventricosum]
MAPSGCGHFSIHVVVVVLVLLQLLAAGAPVVSASAANNTLRPGEELRKYGRIRSHLKRLNRPSLKTIQALPDPLLLSFFFLGGGGYNKLAFCWLHRVQMAILLTDPPERPKGHKAGVLTDDNIQLWRTSGETCPDGTVPIRRTKEEDILRASSVTRFGRKPVSRTRRDSEGSGHECELNSLLQTDAYQATGCYNLLCSGFVQTSSNIAVGAAISPTSRYNGRQFDISLLIWKSILSGDCGGAFEREQRIPRRTLWIPQATSDNLYLLRIGLRLSDVHLFDPKHGNWWLEFGSGVLVGYWPSSLFSHLAGHATMVQFGGEMFNTHPSGFHSSTQMGSGHYAQEGFGRAAYFRNLQVVDWDNSLIPAASLTVLADHPNCYDVQARLNTAWGNYFYFGGPGRSIRCP